MMLSNFIGRYASDGKEQDFVPVLI